ncbi:MAG TPA: hypothetical protein QF604_18265 [Candidatus Latescibacteria bacterium]|jgi:TolB protein|nr:hypothetical protein [Gemmatimonadota bacterium]MDP7364417.1 hypothetical protein [Candidatus Latescibacterota bacterium]MDP7634022.1 hypothetical protein [Candidatus Latescibacterota bacterium]HJN29854.1 hypothetical protein [Candidatus Latescibacterota bacterium]|tara:strand:- start:387 stop:1193 length:807 start_codon:yes stop_codon:yes gene_type:complete
MRLKSICIAVAVFIVSAVVADAQLVGQIVYSSKVWGDSPWVIHIMNANGSGRRALADGMTPSWSPDGECIVYRGRGGIWVMNRDGSGNQLLFEAKDIIDPVFSHDGRRILFNWYRDGESFIYSVDATTGGDPILLPLFPAASTDPGFHGDVTPSPDGRTVAFTYGKQSQQFTANSVGLFVANMDGSDVHLISDVGRHAYPEWSPDSSQLAFFGHRDDGEGIYVANADGTGQALLSAEWAIDWHPTWSPDSEWIAFTSTQSSKSQDIWI